VYHTQKEGKTETDRQFMHVWLLAHRQSRHHRYCRSGP